MRSFALIFLPIVTAFLLAPPVTAAPAHDTSPPRILHEALPTGVIGQNLELRASLRDQSDIFEPKVYFRRVGELEFSTIDLVRSGSEDWLGVIPATFVTRDVEYFIEAYDIMGNGPARHGTPDHPHLVKIATRVDQTTKPRVDATTKPRVDPPLRPRVDPVVKPRIIAPTPAAPIVKPLETAAPADALTTNRAAQPVTKKAWFWLILSAGVLAVAGGTFGALVATGVVKLGAPTSNTLTLRITGPDPREGLPP